MSTECKSCMEQVHISDEMIEEMLQEAHIQPEMIVEDPIYMDRLTICQSCPSLMDGTTCLVNGRFVHFSCKLKNSRCPHSSGARW